MCGKEFIKNNINKYCSEECREQFASNRSFIRDVIIHYKKQCLNEGETCKYCKAKYPRNYGNKLKFCSEKCEKESNKEERKNDKYRKRTLNKSEYEILFRKDIFERDNWTCKICGNSLDKNMVWDNTNRDKFPTLDHIIPLSKGGKHTKENVQTACFTCNSIKGNKL